MLGIWVDWGGALSESSKRSGFDPFHVWRCLYILPEIQAQCAAELDWFALLPYLAWSAGNQMPCFRYEFIQFTLMFSLQICWHRFFLYVCLWIKCYTTWIFPHDEFCWKINDIIYLCCTAWAAIRAKIFNWLILAESFHCDLKLSIVLLGAVETFNCALQIDWVCILVSWSIKKSVSLNSWYWLVIVLLGLFQTCQCVLSDSPKSSAFLENPTRV